MKYAILFAATAALTLGACSKGEDASPAASESAVAEATETAAAMPAGAVPMAASAAAPTEDYLVGTWGEAPGCKQPITFAAGGKITNGPFDSWTLKDGKLTMGPISMMLSVVDDKTMKSKNDGGGEATLMRCK